MPECPSSLGEIASKFDIFYYPIVSSARAFKILFLRAYKNFLPKLGAVVYEDPWLAGGHNGLSNSEDPEKPEKPFERVSLLRKFMRSVGLGECSHSNGWRCLALIRLGKLD